LFSDEQDEQETESSVGESESGEESDGDSGDSGDSDPSFIPGRDRLSTENPSTLIADRLRRMRGTCVLKLMDLSH